MPMPTHDLPALPTYLLRTPSCFYFRMRVPKQHQHILKKRELKKIIRTTDAAVATRQAIIYAAKAFELFDSLQGASLSDYPFTKLVTSVHPNGSVDFTHDSDPVIRRQELLELQELGLIPRHVTSLELSSRVQIPPAQAEAPHPVPDEKPAKFSPHAPYTPDLKISEALELFIAKQNEGNTAFQREREKPLRSNFRHLIESIGDMEIGKITRGDAEKHRALLKELPRNKIGNRCGLTVHQLKALNDPIKTSATTVGMRIEEISSVFNWLIKKNDEIKNPFRGEGTLTKDEKKEQIKAIAKRSPFNTTDLTKIFNYKFFTHLSYTNEWQYWLPLLLLHTGARIGEICQLEKKDVYQVENVWCIHINDIPGETALEPEEVWGDYEKKVKNATSNRRIPLHPILTEKLNFLEFVTASKTERLFPNLRPTDGKLSHYPGRRFNESFLVKMGVKTPEKVFYSFRHTVLNTLKKRSVDSTTRGLVTGHTSQKIDREKFTEFSGRAPDTVNEESYGEEWTPAEIMPLILRLDFSEVMTNVLPWQPPKQRRMLPKPPKASNKSEDSAL